MQVADTQIFDNTLGFDWGPLIGAGIQIGSGYLPQPGGGGSQQCRAPQGCFQCQMTGQGDIAGCIDALLVGQNGGLYGMLVNGRIPNNQVLAAYQQALAALSNPALFKQTDSYLQQAKAALQSHISRYTATGPAATPPATQVVTDPATGQQIVVQVPAQGGIDSTTILLLGGMLGLILILKN